MRIENCMNKEFLLFAYIEDEYVCVGASKSRESMRKMAKKKAEKMGVNIYTYLNMMCYWTLEGVPLLLPVAYPVYVAIPTYARVSVESREGR